MYEIFANSPIIFSGKNIKESLIIDIDNSQTEAYPDVNKETMSLWLNEKITCENNSEKFKVKCAYCKSLYETSEDIFMNSGGVLIKKGAKVTFGKNANVIIKGGLEIEDGAEVNFNGKITLLKKSDIKTIEIAKKKLKKIKKKIL